LDAEIKYPQEKTKDEEIKPNIEHLYSRQQIIHNAVCEDGLVLERGDIQRYANVLRALEKWLALQDKRADAIVFFGDVLMDEVTTHEKCIAEIGLLREDLDNLENIGIPPTDVRVAGVLDKLDELKKLQAKLSEKEM
jgi:hypothetical protein